MFLVTVGMPLKRMLGLVLCQVSPTRTYCLTTGPRGHSAYQTWLQAAKINLSSVLFEYIKSLVIVIEHWIAQCFWYNPLQVKDQTFEFNQSQVEDSEITTIVAFWGHRFSFCFCLLWYSEFLGQCLSHRYCLYTNPEWMAGSMRGASYLHGNW